MKVIQLERGNNMHSKNLEELLISRLLELTYKDTYTGAPRFIEMPVINKEHQQKVIDVVREVIYNNYERNIGILEAKVYAYEKIIANSNFSPMLQERKVEVE